MGLGCCHALAQTGGLSHKHFLPVVMEAQVHDQGARGLASGHTCWQVATFSLYPHTVESRERGTKSLRPLLIRALVPFLGLHPENLSTPQRPHLPTPSRQGLGFRVRILRHANIRSIT